MAEAKIQYNVSLDDESKELIRQLVKAVHRIADAQAPEADVSFGDGGKRLIEEPTYGSGTYAPLHQGERIYSAQEVQEQGERFLRHLAERRLPEGEGDHLLHDDEHEGEELE